MNLISYLHKCSPRVHAKYSNSNQIFILNSITSIATHIQPILFFLIFQTLRFHTGTHPSWMSPDRGIIQVHIRFRCPPVRVATQVHTHLRCPPSVLPHKYTPTRCPLAESIHQYTPQPGVSSPSFTTVLYHSTFTHGFPRHHL